MLSIRQSIHRNSDKNSVSDFRSYLNAIPDIQSISVFS